MAATMLSRSHAVIWQFCGGSRGAKKRPSLLLQGVPSMKALFHCFSRCTIGVLKVGSCLLAAPLDAKEGDLDPSFGDVGRVGPISAIPGSGWSIYAMEDGSLVIGGGEVIRSCPADIIGIGCVPPGHVGFTA